MLGLRRLSIQWKLALLVATLLTAMAVVGVVGDHQEHVAVLAIALALSVLLSVATYAHVHRRGEAQQYRINDWWTPTGGGMYPGTFWHNRDGQRDRSAVFAEWEGRKSAQWMTLLGARYEQVTMNAGAAVGYNPAGGGNQARDANAFNARSHQTTDNNLDQTAAASYTASDNYAIEFGFAHKTRSPNVYERFTWSTWQMAALMNNFVGDGNGYFGDLALKPEQANKLSAPFDWLGLQGHMPLAKSSMGDFGLKGLLNFTHGTN